MASNKNKGVRNARQTTSKPKEKSNKQKYTEGLDRFYKSLSKMEEQGYVFDKLNVKDPLSQRISKDDVNYINKKAFSEAILNASFVTEDGEMITARDKLDFASFEEVSINNFKITLATADTPVSDVLMNWLTDMTNDFGAEVVSKVLNNASADNKLLSRKILYDKEATLSYMSSMTDYMVQEGYMDVETKNYIDDSYQDMLEEI